MDLVRGHIFEQIETTLFPYHVVFPEYYLNILVEIITPKFEIVAGFHKLFTIY